MGDRLRPKHRVSMETPASPLPAPAKPPQLLWSSVTYEQGVDSLDTTHFPDLDRVYERYDAVERGIECGLRAFEQAVTEAAIHVLVLDPHFDRQGAEILGGALLLSQARDVRLLTSRGGLLEEERKGLASMLTESCNEGRLDNLKVEARWSAALDRHDFPFLHDRFAVVDGSLWHFGATVGGGHRGLTAASGPWPAVKSRAIVFFDECWRRYSA